jgi:hypothetical protein
MGTEHAAAGDEGQGILFEGSVVLVTIRGHAVANQPFLGL